MPDDDHSSDSDAASDVHLDGKDAPSFYIHWHTGAVLETVNLINARANPVAAAWYPNARYPLAPEHLTVAIAKHLASFGGSLMGDGLLATDTMPQSLQIICALRDLCYDPFFAGVVNSPLGSIYVVRNRASLVDGERLRLAPPPVHAARLFD